MIKTNVKINKSFLKVRIHKVLVGLLELKQTKNEDCKSTYCVMFNFYLL